MQLRAATSGPLKDGGWLAAFVLASCAAALSGIVLLTVLLAIPASTDPTIAAPAITPDSPAASTVEGTVTPTPTPPRSPTPRLPRATVAPVQPFGRTTELVEDWELREVILSVLGERADEFGVVVVEPRDRRSAFVNADREFYAASLFKLAVLYEAGLRVSRGELDLEEHLEISEEDLEQDLNTMQYQERDEDGNLTIQNALDAMVTFSDNSTGVALLHLFSGAAIDATLRGLGVESTSVNTKALPTTARDMARIMDAIVAGEGLDPASHALLLGMLSRQQVRSGIPEGLPAGVDSGNKTGTWDDITHDVGYVEAETGVYIIAILSETDRDWDTIAELSEAVYEHLSER